jgi:hypothetical protein
LPKVSTENELEGAIPSKTAPGSTATQLAGALEDTVNLLCIERKEREARLNALYQEIEQLKLACKGDAPTDLYEFHHTRPISTVRSKVTPKSPSRSRGSPKQSTKKLPKEKKTIHIRSPTPPPLHRAPPPLQLRSLALLAEQMNKKTGSKSSRFHHVTPRPQVSKTKSKIGFTHLSPADLGSGRRALRRNIEASLTDLYDELDAEDAKLRFANQFPIEE